MAALLAVAFGLTLAPTASAASRVDAVRSVLDDVAAFDAALDAARGSADPVQAFAQAYEAATDGAVQAEAVVRLIGGASMSGVSPVPPTETVARAQLTSPPSTPSASSYLVLSVAPIREDAPAARCGSLVPANRPEARPAQPRGP